MTITTAAEGPSASSLQPFERPSVEQAAAAVRDSLRRHGGSRGCAAVRAAEYGARSETAHTQMRWALALAEQIRRPARLAA
jgi:hypothetical protein